MLLPVILFYFINPKFGSFDPEALRINAHESLLTLLIVF